MRNDVVSYSPKKNTAEKLCWAYHLHSPAGSSTQKLFKAGFRSSLCLNFICPKYVCLVGWLFRQILPKFALFVKFTVVSSLPSSLFYPTSTPTDHTDSLGMLLLHSALSLPPFCRLVLKVLAEAHCWIVGATHEWQGMEVISLSSMATEGVSSLAIG